MAKLLTPNDVARIFDAQPLSELEQWLSFWQFHNHPFDPPIERQVTLLRAFFRAFAVAGTPFQIEIKEVSALNVPFLAATQRFNITEVGEPFIRSPGTLRWNMSAVELVRPTGFPRPRPR